MRKPGVERRREIAGALLRMIGEKGITAFTTAALAAEVGVTSGALFRHFATRDEILLETVRVAVAQIDRTFPDPELAPADRLFQFARERIALLGEEPGILWLLQSDQASLVLPSEAGELLQKRIKRSRQFVLKAIRDGISQGCFREDVEPEALVVFVMGTIHALLASPGKHRSASRSKSQNPERVLDALARLMAPA